MKFKIKASHIKYRNTAYFCCKVNYTLKLSAEILFHEVRNGFETAGHCSHKIRSSPWFLIYKKDQGDIVPK